ncbi:MAG: nucleotidyltransferase domain-containing protein [Deltaproteobacteria bacterium]|nr:nucleotidyltransferase domain-containing protein [Deltaproteobacteria bacterium]
MPTTSELPREEWKKYIAASCRRLPPRGLTPLEALEREKLLAPIRKASDALKSRFGVRRVVLFGSLAHAEWFTEDSDVDLVVEGLEGKDYWRAWRLAEEIMGDRLVDFIETETAWESLRSTIERSGVEL